MDNMIQSRLKVAINSELLLERRPWDVVDSIWLLNALITRNLCTNSWHLAITHKWYSAAAIGGLRGHSVEACDHSDDATIKENETEGTDSDNAIKQDLVIWLPFDIAILINLCRHTGCARGHENHNKLDQQ